MKLLLLFLYFSLINAFEEDYYEETEGEIDEIICSTDKECPKHQPKCKRNHCQPECFANADCGLGNACHHGKCEGKKIVTKERFSVKSRSDKNGEPEYVEYEESEGIPADFVETEETTMSSEVDPDDVSYDEEYYEDELVQNKSLIEVYDEVIDSKTLGKDISLLIKTKVY